MIVPLLLLDLFVSVYQISVFRSTASPGCGVRTISFLIVTTLLI